MDNNLINWSNYNHFLTCSTNQVKPSSKPSWVLAEQAVMVQVLVWIFYIFNCSRIYIGSMVLVGVTAPGLDLVYSRRLIVEHLLVISRPGGIPAICRLRPLSWCRRSRWHRRVRRCWGNSWPSTIWGLAVLRYPTRWVWIFRGWGSWYWSLQWEWWCLYPISMREQLPHWPVISGW